MTPETFLCLTQTQWQGLSTLASTALTLALVWATWQYVRLTRGMSDAARKSHEHMVRMRAEELESERAVVAAGVASIKQGLKRMLELDVATLASRHDVPERIPGVHLPGDRLLQFGRGISPQMAVSLGSLIHHVEAGEHDLERIRHGPSESTFLRLKAESALAYFQLGLDDAEECLRLAMERKPV